MATNLSKQWTLKSLIGILRTFVNEITPKKIQNLQLIDIIHLAIVDVVQQLGMVASKDYVVTPVTVTQTSDVIDISSYVVDQIIKLTDSGTGLIIPKDADEIESIDDPQLQGEIYWTRLGEKIYLKKGSDVSAYGTLKLYYSRAPLKVTELTDTLDIKDTFIPLVVDKAKIKVYEMLNMTPPEQLQNQVNAAIANVKASTAQEMEAASKIKG